VKSVSIHSFLYYILLITFLFEATTGALRYYSDKLGLGLIVYIPKLLMFLSIFLMFSIRPTFESLIFGLIVLCYLLYSILTLPLASVMFGLYLLSPFFFGMLYAQNYSIDYSSDVVKIMKIVYWISMTGIWIEFFHPVPWEGYEQVIGGVYVEASRQWGMFGFDRLAGFSRISSIAAIFIAISSIFYIFSEKSGLLKLLFFILSVPSIAMTTNKAVLTAYLISSPLLFRFIRERFLKISIILGSLFGVLLPLLSIFSKFYIDLNNPMSLLYLSSFQERLSYTWPHVYRMVSEFSEDFILRYFWGLGIGGFGTSAKYFFIADLGVADNMWLYIYSMFGIFGVLFMFYIVFNYVKNRKNDFDVYAYSLNLLLWIGLTTDIFESLIALFLIGYMSHISKYNKKRCKTGN